MYNRGFYNSSYYNGRKKGDSKLFIDSPVLTITQDVVGKDYYVTVSWQTVVEASGIKLNFGDGTQIIVPSGTNTYTYKYNDNGIYTIIAKNIVDSAYTSTHKSSKNVREQVEVKDYGDYFLVTELDEIITTELGEYLMFE